MTPDVDPVCLAHGLRMSEHDCLFCCLCLKPLTPEECHVRPDGVKEDVCKKCAAAEQQANECLPEEKASERTARPEEAQ